METNEQTEKIVNAVLEQAKEQFNNNQVVEQKVLTDVADTIEKQYEKNRNELATKEEFIGLTEEITERSAKAKLGEDMLAVMSQEHKNALSAYALDCEKQKLEFRTKKEKKLILEDVKADIAKKKIETLEKRYGYMYEDGEPFIPSKSYNRQREIVNWWNGLSDNIKKAIKGVLKVCFWGGVIVLTVILGKRVVQWIIENVKFN
jgi:hypothetical protein